ncbi:hypothetical protein LUZ60_004301 [Juncus effusus]|nr:hypothetical protein LUZ60_004301 [Juncus effusus]
MWGRYYWGKKKKRNELEGDDSGGIIVVFAWLSSQEKHLKPYIDLYSSFGWSSLVCHSQFPTQFFPERAAALADGVIKELFKELKIKPMPVVFSSFSGGPKGCTYKVLQLINRTCKGQLNPEEYQLVKDCLCGQIFDSSPVDFKSDTGTKFVLHPTVLKMSEPPRVLKWAARVFASSLDSLFMKNFEEQRNDFWQTLYNSANVGPILIFCSETDDLAPYSVIHEFAKKLEERGADVSMMKWDVSPHVGHYKYHPDEYRASVKNLLQKAAKKYSNKKQLNMSHLSGQVDPFKNAFKPVRTASDSNERLKRGQIDRNSLEFQENQEDPKPELFDILKVTRVLLDVCKPKDVEGWEVKDDLVVSGMGNSVFRRSRL